MKTFDVIAAILVVVGAANWGLVGLFQFDLVAAFLGDGAMLSRFVYCLVGIAGLFQAWQWKSIQRRWCASAAMTAA